MTRAIAHIHLPALSHNLAQARRFAPNARIIGVVKSNAYGHGLIPVAQHLVRSGIAALAVHCVSEALQLRAAGIATRIIVLAGFMDRDELQRLNAAAVDIVVHDVAQIPLLTQTPLSTPQRIWLKIDSGMHRLGFLPEQVASIYSTLRAQKNISEMGFITHFSEADNPRSPKTAQQIELFYHEIGALPGPKSLANSAGIVRWPASHGDWVRAGIMLYGISPLPQQVGSDFNLKPVMTLTSRLLAVRQLPAGCAVGYGSEWVTPEAMTVGVVALGYGDGYPRHVPTGTPVLIQGQQCSIIGRVSMDMVSVDLRTCGAAQVGDVVTFWGQALPCERIAAQAGSIAYQLLCGVTGRVAFDYHE